MNERWRSFWLLLRWSIAGDKKASIFLLAVSVMTMLAGVATGIALKVLIDRAARGEPAEAAAAVLSLLVVAQVLGGVLAICASSNHQERSRERLDAEIMRIVTGAPGIDHHEDPAFQDQLEMLRDGGCPEFRGISVAGPVIRRLLHHHRIAVRQLR